MQQVQELVAHPRNVFFEHGPAVVEILPVPGLHPLLEDKEAPFERRREFLMVWAIQATVSPTTATLWASSSSRVREATSSSRCSVWRRICSRREYCSAARFSEWLQQVVVDGLAMKSAAPRRRHSTALSMSPCPVIMTTCVSGFWLRTRSSRARPSMPGIRMSVTTMGKGLAVNASSASRALSAVWTS